MSPIRPKLKVPANPYAKQNLRRDWIQPIEATRSGRKTAHRVDLVESCASTIEAVITANSRPDRATIRRRMISRVPIFASLNQKAITEIAKRLRAHVALPGEKLVSKGKLADAMYFEGERLPATYANFLIINGAVLMPTYNSPAKDELAKRES